MAEVVYPVYRVYGVNQVNSVMAVNLVYIADIVYRVNVGAPGTLEKSGPYSKNCYEAGIAPAENILDYAMVMGNKSESGIERLMVVGEASKVVTYAPRVRFWWSADTATRLIEPKMNKFQSISAPVFLFVGIIIWV